jgi:hypothetical protein
MSRHVSGSMFAIAVAAGFSACDSSTASVDAVPVLSAPIVDLTKVVRFIPFGADLPGSGVKNPAYELVVTGTNLEVRAATAGRVARMLPNEQGDIELHVAVPDSEYVVIYDHVLNVSVAIGQAVQPGTVLGTVGAWMPTERRVELQINRGNVAHCPKDLGTSDFNAAHDEALAAADLAQQDPAWTSVCLATTVTP